MIHRPGAGGGEWARPRSWAEPARRSEIPAHPPRATEMVGTAGGRGTGRPEPRPRVSGGGRLKPEVGKRLSVNHAALAFTHCKRHC